MGVFGVETKDGTHNFTESKVIFDEVDEDPIFAKPRASKLRKLEERDGRLDGEPGDGGGSIEHFFVVGPGGTSFTAIEAGFEVVLRRKGGGGDGVVMMIVEHDGGLMGVGVEHELLKEQWERDSRFSDVFDDKTNRKCMFLGGSGGG